MAIKFFGSFTYTGSADVFGEGGWGNDRQTSGSGNDTLVGNNGDDTLSSGYGSTHFATIENNRASFSIQSDVVLG